MAEKEQSIKCVVWDLDNTIWNGVLLEDSNVKLKDGVLEIIKVLDERGILQSIASKNEYNSVMEKLNELGIADYFLYPQINWNAKSGSIKKISELINIGIDTVAFVDDQPFELEEVRHVHQKVMCIDAAKLGELPHMPRMTPRFITEDSKIRRKLYMSDIERNREEEKFEGASEEFLASLGMKLTISSVADNDLKRCEELTVRTHQLNATGYTYSYEELDVLRKSKNHILFIADLEDKYGTYGKIGLCLIECAQYEWTIKLLLMSCRVMSRGVGSVMMNHVLRLAKEAGVKLKAEFVETDRNRMMYITYKFAGFNEVGEVNGVTIFENNLDNIQDNPDYMRIHIVQDNSVGGKRKDGKDSISVYRSGSAVCGDDKRAV